MSDVAFSFLNEENPTEGVKFKASHELNNTYSLLIPEGSYFTQTYVDSNHTLGFANAQLRYDFSPSDILSGIKSVSMSDKDILRTVYTSQGIRLHEDATDAQLRALAPGLYIIAGKKVMVK